MSEKVVVVARLRTVNETRRDQLLDRLRVLASVAQRDEPGTLKYASFIPREDDSTTVYAVEEYADKASFDLHMASPAVKAANEWLAEEDVLDSSSKPELHMLEYISGFGIIREEVQQHSDPYVLFAEIDYVPSGVGLALPFWDSVVQGSRGEKGTLMYGIMRDTQKKDRLCALEAYESPEYLRNVHVASIPIQRSIENTKHLRAGLTHHVLRKKDGFLHKP